MIRNVYLTLAFLLTATIGTLAQTGGIRGKIFDKTSKEPIPFATVVAEMNGTQVSGGQSDFDGEYTIKPLNAGKYTLKIKYTGYKEMVINDVLVSGDRSTFQDLALSKQVFEFEKAVEVVSYKAPLFERDNVTQGATLTRDEIEAAPTRDVRSVAAQAASVFQKDEGDAVNVRGSRDEATDYYVDGIRIRGSQKLPQSGIEQVTVIVGGTPAQYGDATGGVISITTRGPSKEFNGSLEYVTSELFDDYGYNLVSGSLSGPLLKKKLENGGEKAILGFFVSGEFQKERDFDPSGIGMYKLKDDVFDKYAQNPITPYNDAGLGAFNNALFFKSNDFEKVKVKDNVDQLGYRFTSKLDFQPFEFTTITLGGSFNVNDRDAFAINRAVYNANENPQIRETDWRVFARLTQRVASTYKAEQEKSASVFRNVYFSLQGEFSKNQTRNQDRNHGDNLFAYGWFGKFENNRTRTYANVLDTSGNVLGQVQTGYNNDFSYAPVGANSLTENFNTIAYNFLTTIPDPSDPTALNTITDVSEIRNGGGVRNGDGIGSVMGIWESIGNVRNRFINDDNDQYRITLTGNADIKKHSILVGFEFEQRVDRQYDIQPRGLWTVGRQLATQKFVNIASEQDTIFNSNGTFTLNYNTGYSPTLDDNGNVINGFYENLRSSLGLSNTDYVDFDALTPDQLDVSMFTPDDLIDNNLLVRYYGFNYAGEKFTGNPTFNDFFTKKKDGNYTREIGAFMPTYMAGYIQDRFTVDNMSFNIGLRIDRFDANQKALKDKFLLVSSYTVDDYPIAIENKPDNIGGDFVPYLGTPGDFSSVIGYRDGSTWYDVNGNVVINPDIIAQQSSTGLIVAAEKPDAGRFATEDWNIDAVFEDYKPQISIMPRIAFAFNITDEAQFFAHYDVLTQRPSSNLRNDPMEYITLRNNPDGTINNSNLKPERTTDYEVGFKQRVSKSSALTISAFYRELKNMIQITRFNYAYPNTYTSYDNIDFGTVKGLSLSYDLRRTGNVRMLASYTLQFADGTGSGATSNAELTDTDQPNIRFIIPLDYDTRHQITTSLDYRYQSGADYNGPILFGKPIFENAGANFVFRTNSGTPYSRQSRPTQEAAAIGWQDNGQRAIEGVINGARTPWQFRIDMRLDKDINLKFSDKKNATLNVYLQIQNLLDTRNVVNVYRATGNANDDGFLQSVDGQLLSSQQEDSQAFIDQYNIRLQNPDFYSLPRRARLGVRLDF
jgi:outer membrane receptor protein involved in Fe transport